MPLWHRWSQLDQGHAEVMAKKTGQRRKSLILKDSFATIWAPICENLMQNKVGHPGRRQHLQASSQ
jgi:hypothetical protein